MYIDGGKQVLEECGGQLQVFLPAKIVHHHQRCSLQSLCLARSRQGRICMYIYACMDIKPDLG